MGEMHVFDLLPQRDQRFSNFIRWCVACGGSI